MSIGWTEIVVILLVVLILFGARRLPDLARSLGKSVHEFKKGLNEVTEDKSLEKKGTDTNTDKEESK